MSSLSQYIGECEKEIEELHKEIDELRAIIRDYRRALNNRSSYGRTPG